MRPESPYEAWKRRRSADAGARAVPEGFADRVMAALPPRRRPHTPPWTMLSQFLTDLLASPVGKLGICTLGGLAGAFRMLSLISLFLPA
jgi:hypothetical protein